MSIKIFNKEKKDDALKAISELCLHCKNHNDDCGIVKAEEAVQTLHTEK